MNLILQTGGVALGEVLVVAMVLVLAVAPLVLFGLVIVKFLRRWGARRRSHRPVEGRTRTGR